MSKGGYDAVCGGFGPTEPADDSIQDLCKQVKPQAEKEANKSFPLFDPILYRRQVVAGTNYLIKVHVGTNDYVHLFVYISRFLVHAVPIERLDIQLGKTLDDPLVPWQFKPTDV